MDSTELAAQRARNYLSTLHNVARKSLETELLIRQLVRAAIVDGATWRMIGDALGVSAQAAHQRFSSPTPRKIMPGEEQLPIESDD